MREHDSLTIGTSSSIAPFFKPSFSFVKMTKKILAALAFAPVAVLAEGNASDYPTQLPSAVDTAVSSAITGTQQMATDLAGKIGPAVLQIGAAFLVVAVAFFCYRLVVKFLAGSKRG